MLYLQRLDQNIDRIFKDYSEWADKISVFNSNLITKNLSFYQPILGRFLDKGGKLEMLIGQESLYLEKQMIVKLISKGTQIKIACNTTPAYSSFCFENSNRIFIILSFSGIISPFSNEKAISGMLLDENDKFIWSLRKTLNSLWQTSKSLQYLYPDYTLKRCAVSSAYKIPLVG